MTYYLKSMFYNIIGGWLVISFFFVLPACTLKPKAPQGELWALLDETNNTKILFQCIENAQRLKNADSLFSTATEYAILNQVKTSDNNTQRSEKNSRLARKILNVALGNYLSDLKNLYSNLLLLCSKRNIDNIRNPVEASKKTFTTEVITLLDIHAYLHTIGEQLLALGSGTTTANEAKSILKALSISQKVCIFFYENNKIPNYETVCTQTSVKEKIYATHSNGKFKFYVGRFSSFRVLDSVLSVYNISGEDVAVSEGEVRLYHNYPKSPVVVRNYVYIIQVAAFETDVGAENLPNIDLIDKSLVVREIDGMYKYFVEYFATFEEAERFKQINKLRDGFILKKKNNDVFDD